MLPVLGTFRFAIHGVLRQHIPLGLGSASRVVVALSCRLPVRPSVGPSAGAVAGGLPPGSSLLPRFPCPRADITAQRRSPGVTQGGRRMGGHGRMPDPLGGKRPHQHWLLPEHSTVRSLSFPPHPSSRETEAQAEGRRTPPPPAPLWITSSGDPLPTGTQGQAHAREHPPPCRTHGWP